jgi:hypothetical protein
MCILSVDTFYTRTILTCKPVRHKKRSSLQDVKKFLLSRHGTGICHVANYTADASHLLNVWIQAMCRKDGECAQTMRCKA